MTTIQRLYVHQFVSHRNAALLARCLARLARKRGNMESHRRERRLAHVHCDMARYALRCSRRSTQ